MGKWLKLMMSCPVPGCPNRSKVTGWTAVRCNSTVYINDDGIMECAHSNCETGPMYQWRFDCGSTVPGNPHNLGNSRFKAGDRVGFTHSFGVAMAMGMLGKAEMAWVQRLMQAIDRQFPYSS